MPGPQDYIVGNAPRPASFAAPLVDFGALANLPEAYYSGQKMAREAEMRDAFRGGVPTTTDPQGRQIPDVPAIWQKGLQLGGLPYAQGLMQYFYNSQIGGDVAKALGGDGQQQQGEATPNPANANPHGASPANLGKTNIATIIGQQGGDPDDPIGQTIADKLGVPDAQANLTPDQAALVENALKQGKVGQRQAAATPGTAGTVEERGGGAPSGAPAPVTPPGSAGVAGPAGPIATPPASFQQRFAGAPEVPTTQAPYTGARPVRTTQETGGLPLPAGLRPGESPEGAIARLNTDIQRTQAAALRASAMTGTQGSDMTKTLNDRVSKLQEDKNKIIDFVGKQRELSTAKREALESGTPGGSPLLFEQQKKAGELATTALDKVERGFAGQATTAAGALKNITLARGLVNTPSFYSGSFEGINLELKRLIATAASTPIGRSMGLDPSTPLSQEAFRKVMAANILQQVDDLKSAATEMGDQQGRIFGSQIEMMQKAAQNPDNSIASNRALTEISYRSAQHAIEQGKAVDQMAKEYKATHGGVLDYGFNNKIADWIVQHPVFTDAELADPRLLGAATIPKQIGNIQDRAKAKDALYTWAAGVGLKNGDPMRTPDGAIKWLHVDPATQIQR
jgi:hypothetical protein